MTYFELNDAYNQGKNKCILRMASLSKSLFVFYKDNMLEPATTAIKSG